MFSILYNLCNFVLFGRLNHILHNIIILRVNFQLLYYEAIDNLHITALLLYI